MAKKKTTYYQAVCYTTDHCDDDLIAPMFWNPTKDRKEAASEIMAVHSELFSLSEVTAQTAESEHRVVLVRLVLSAFHV